MIILREWNLKFSLTRGMSAQYISRRVSLIFSFPYSRYITILYARAEGTSKADIGPSRRFASKVRNRLSALSSNPEIESQPSRRLIS